MAAHRAWRVYVDRSNGQNIVGLSELQFRATAGGADWTGGVGQAIASASLNTSLLPPNAFDGTGSEWISPGASTNNVNHWIGWDLGANPANWQDLAELVMTSRTTDPTNGPGQMVRDCRIEWTDDPPSVPGTAARWTRDWAVGPTTGWTLSETRTYTRPAKTNQTRWRLYGLSSPQNSGYMAFAEVEFRTALGGAQAATGGTPIASGSFNLTDHAPSQAYDGITVNNRWASDQIFPAWIGYQWAAGVTIVQAKAWARTESVGEANQAPQYLSLDAGSDGVSWVVVAEWSTMPWTQGSTWVLTVPEEDQLTIPKLAPELLVGGYDSQMMVTKIAMDAVIGGRTDMLTASKLTSQLLEGALPQRITFSKLAPQLLEGALPQRISFSKLAAQVLLFKPPRAINGPVQIF